MIPVDEDAEYAELVRRVAADSDSVLAALGLQRVRRPCGYCGHEVPAGRRRYCSNRCSATVRQARWRAKAAG